MAAKQKYYWIHVETNYWRGETVWIRDKLFATAEKAMKDFDDNHRCDKDSNCGCDYCKATWKRSYDDWVRGVDHDGAFVEYEVKRVTLEG